MGLNRFTEEQQKELSKSPFIQKVSDKFITYTTEFKERFAAEYRQGKTPSQILIDMEIDHRLLGKKRKDAMVAGMKKYELRPEGYADTRKGNSGRPSIKDLSDIEKISSLEQKVSYLLQENEFLKKHSDQQNGRMKVQAKPSEKYKLIKGMLGRNGNLLNISWLCQTAGVSRSRYYNWLNAADTRQIKDASDKKDSLRHTGIGGIRKAQEASICVYYIRASE